MHTESVPFLKVILNASGLSISVANGRVGLNEFHQYVELAELMKVENLVKNGLGTLCQISTEFITVVRLMWVSRTLLPQ